MARNLNEEYGSRVIGGRRCVHVRESQPKRSRTGHAIANAPTLPESTAGSGYTVQAQAGDHGGSRPRPVLDREPFVGRRIYGLCLHPVSVSTRLREFVTHAVSRENNRPAEHPDRPQP